MYIYKYGYFYTHIQIHIQILHMTDYILHMTITYQTNIYK